MNQIFTFSNLGSYGALGNQLWQIAGVVGEADKMGTEVYFPDWEYNPYFSLPGEYFEPKDGEYIDFWPGYLQDLRHFNHIEVLIRDLFSPSEYLKYLVEEAFPWGAIEGDRVVGVHIRRADSLVSSNYYPSCPLDYYEAALDAIVFDEILVCSDNIDWCKKQSIFKDAHFGVGTPKGIDISELSGKKPMTNAEAVIDLMMLSMCDSQIIANSSFSWWAAWLGDGEFVVYPEKWYGPALQGINTDIMFPERWNKMEFDTAWK